VCFNRFALFSLLCALSLNTAAAGHPGDAPAQILAYRFEPRQPLKYRLVAAIKGRLPIGDAIEPVDLTAKLSFTYTAAPRTRLMDGTSDVDFKVGPVDLEVLSIPFSVPDEDAKKVLNLTATFAPTGEVMKVQTPGNELPFSVSVPGVDPKRLYALIFPIVFKKTAVKQGDSWEYRSDLLGGQGTVPHFTATLSPSAGAPRGMSRLKQTFDMPVDQKLDADKKPVTNPEDVHRVKSGKIDGEGLYLFDSERGRLTRGDLTIRAKIKDVLVGKPLDDKEPAELESDVEAKVTIELVSGEGSGGGGAKPKTAAPRGQTVLQTAKKEKP
jgi:hypothetical protein